VNPREIFFAALERQQVPRVPFVETSIAFGIGEKLLGRKLTPVTIPQLGIKMRNVEDEKELARLLYRDDICFRFTAPTFSAKTVGKDGQSFAGEGLIKSMDDFKSKFFLPDPEDDSMYEPVKPFIEKKEEFPVICSMRLGFLSALISIGFQTFMEAIYLDPELIDTVMNAYVDWSTKAIRRLCDMGVDAIKTTDDFAYDSGPFISPKAFRQLVVGYHDRAHREISTPWILHTDGVITPIIEDILSMGIDAIHPIDPNCMDIRMFKRDYGDRVCIIGNVDINTLTMGSTDDVYQETRDLIRDLAPGYGYIVSAGNSIPEYVNSENVLAMSRAVRDFGAYPR
jgi:uroporphyrinogen decarboxylase